jgi:hypothetical protein
MSELKPKINPLDSFKPNDALLKKNLKKLEDAKEDGFVVAKLSEIKVIQDFPEIEANILASFYFDKDSDVVRFGSILNAAFAESKAVFQLAVGSVNDLTVKDPHHTLKSCDGDYYKKMIAKAIARKWIVQLRPPDTGKVGARKGGIYEIIDPVFLEPLLLRKGAAQHLAEKEYILDWYENGPEIKKDKEPTPEELAFDADMRKRAAEKRKARNET